MQQDFHTDIQFISAPKKTFTLTSNLYQHLRRVHRIETRTGTLQCPKLGCEFTCPKLADIRTHLAQRHQATNVRKRTEMAFNSTDDFVTWKVQEENTTSSSFVLRRAPITVARTELKRQVYYCNRSGKYQLEGSGRIRMKSQGSCKTGKCCPAAMETEIFPDGSIKLLYWSGHFGHSSSLAHIHLSDTERAEIAGKLAQGASFNAVLDDVRSNATGPLKRIHLLSRKDLHNIRISFDQRAKKHHENDAAAVALWVERLEKLGYESPVLMYKAQGVKEGLAEDDFLLILMSRAQADMLKQFGGDKICIDSSKSDFYLTTVLVVDEFGSGFPVAFCLSNRINVAQMELFFAAVKEKVGKVHSYVFMSDDVPVYYDAWKVVMGEADTCLLNTWFVDEKWSEEIRKHVAGGKIVQDRVYKRLRTLVNTGDEDSLKLLVPFCVDFLLSNETTKAFGTYFQRTYAPRVEAWALCFRTEVGVNTNVRLESMHQVLKDIFLERKKENRLDNCLTALVKLSRDQTFERMIRLCPNLSTKTVEEINQQHEKSLEIDVADVQRVEEGWKVTSETNSYLVRKVEDCPTNCGMTCKNCRVCFHMYTCMCPVAMLHCTVCKHVHAVVNKFGMDTADATIDEEINSFNAYNKTNAENRKQSVKLVLNRCLGLIDSDDIEDAKILQLELFAEKWLAEAHQC